MSKFHGQSITDASGRRLKLRELEVLEESRLVRMIGASTAENRVYMSGYVIPVVAVAAIDDDALDIPGSLRELESAITRVGNAGIRAVLEHMVAAGEAENPDDVKNS